MTPQMQAVRDAFRNPGANTGFGTSSLLEATEYPLSRMSWNYTRLIALYRTSWLVRAIIDTIPEDMFKNWLNITGETEPKLLSQFDRVLRKTKTKAKLLEAMKWGRLYGGGGAVILIKGHERKLDKPLNLEDVPLDGYCGLQVFDRWSGITPDLTRLIDDITSPDYGLPEFYSVMAPDGQLSTTYPRVHYTRVIRFTGRHLPMWERQAEMYWGLSEVELIWDALRMSDNTQWNIASMMFTANVFVFKSGANISQLLAATPGDIQQKVYGMLAAQRAMMNSQGMMVTDKEGGLESHQLSFSGIAEVWDKFLLILCAAAQIPKSRLLGDTQTGISSSNEGDQNTYYDNIRAKQTRELDPVMDQLLPIIAMSTWGEIPDDFGHTWNPLHSPSNKEKSDLAKQNVEAILLPFQAGDLISPRTVLLELKQQSEITGIFSNISDADISAASDEVNPPMGELGLGGEDAPGLPAPKAKEKKPVTGAKKDDKEKPDAKKAKGGRPMKDAELIPISGAPFDITFAGLPITVEVPAGETRTILNDEGDVVYQQLLENDYGELAGTLGRDGDPIDVILGPNERAPFVYIADFVDLGPVVEERQNEDKILLGFNSLSDATTAFKAMYPPSFLGGMKTVPLGTFIGEIMLGNSLMAA